MSRFEYCLQKVLGHEGGYADHPNDRGGKTNYGVTTKTYDDFRALRGLPKQSVKFISQHEVELIYGSYWRDAHCAYMPEPLDMLMLDAAINHGPRRAIKLLQDALGADVDGVCGKQTMQALHEEMVTGNIADLCALYLELRKVFYNQIIFNDPTQEVFRNGWMARVDHLHELVETA